MANAGSSTPHDTAVPFTDEVIADGRLDPNKWDWWSSQDGGVTHYYAEGPCPACHANAQGHVALVPQPVDKQGPGDATTTLPTAATTVEVPVACRCGTPHGQDGAKGCGRRWTIVGPTK
jgi:hypothetical protein